MEMHDTDLKTVLKNDGVNNVVVGELENIATTNVNELCERMGPGPWAARLVLNERFGGVLIQQRPGEGNRLHYHPDADECWVILSGKWEWFIEGEGTKEVSVNDIVVVKKGVKHKITCIGDTPGIRFAITAPDVDHVYSEG
jgi:mannose-6-phosphate isomerase-like protein (cupin superfamily)